MSCVKDWGYSVDSFESSSELSFDSVVGLQKKAKQNKIEKEIINLC